MKYSNKNFAFSLIELMVVVAIVAVLAAVAIPAYKNYIVKSQVATSLYIMDAEATKLLQYYNQHGTFPEIYNTKLVNQPNDIIYYIYAWKGCAPNYSGDCMQLVTIFNDGVIPGGQAPSATPGTGNALLMLVFGNVNGMQKTYCGSYSQDFFGGYLTMPENYLPQTCIPNLNTASGMAAGVPS